MTRKENGSVNHAERQSRYVKVLAGKLRKAKDNLETYRRLVDDYETKIDVAGNPHLFDKVTGYLAMQHEVSKQDISKIRAAVKRA